MFHRLFSPPLFQQGRSLGSIRADRLATFQHLSVTGRMNGCLSVSTSKNVISCLVVSLTHSSFSNVSKFNVLWFLPISRSLSRSVLVCGAAIPRSLQTSLITSRRDLHPKNPERYLHRGIMETPILPGPVVFYGSQLYAAHEKPHGIRALEILPFCRDIYPKRGYPRNCQSLPDGMCGVTIPL